MRNLNWRVARISLELNLIFLGLVVGSSELFTSAWYVAGTYAFCFSATIALTYFILDNWKGRMARYE